MMPLKITVPIYAKVSKKKTILLGLNWYTNAHFHQRSKVKRSFVGIISDQPRINLKKGKYKVHYDIYIKRKGTDGGNVRSVVEKFGLDALQELKWLSNDDFETIIGSSDDYYLDRDNPRCEITFKKVKDEKGKSKRNN